MNQSAAIILLPLLVGAGLGAAGTAIVRRTARGRGFVDQPGGHKGHAAPVALGGGVAVVLAVVLPILAVAAAANLFAEHPPAWLPEAVLRHLPGIVRKTPVALGIAAAALAMCGLGLLDDARPIRPGSKFIVQVAIAAFLVLGLKLRLLSHLGWGLSAVLSILWIVGLCNSLNFLDNMDGLAAGVAAIAALVFAATAMGAGQVFVPACCALLAGSLAGFLPFNLHPASIFLGDAGSLVVGLLLAVFTILTTFADPALGQHPVGVLAPLVVMAVPLYDTTSVVLLRWRGGQAIWTADRRHFSHRLVRRGMSVPRAVAVIWLATLVTAGPALLLPAASWPLAWGIVVHTLLIVLLVALLERGEPNDSPAP